MIRSALGASSLENNALALAAILQSQSGAIAPSIRAAAWAAQAFRQAGADEVHIEKSGDSGQLENVVAEIRGRDQPRDYVLVGAILEGPPGDPLRVAESVAVLIDAVRVIHHTGNIPRRSIRFVLFAGGAAVGARDHAPLAGVWAYIRAHRADLDRVAAAVSLGPPHGAVDSFSLQARSDMLAAVQQALVPLRSLGVRNFTQQVQISAVVTPLWLEGVPTLVATSSFADDAEHQRYSGASATSVSIPSSDVRDLKRRVAVAAVASYALADDETLIARRRSRAEVEKAIAAMRILPELRSSGELAQWQFTDSR